MSSSMVDEDTRRTIDEGRETLGEFLSVVQTHLQKVFVAFAVAMVATVWAMRAFVWDILREITEARMNEATAQELDILVRTPFDVILLQVKIGLAVGAVAALPVLLYYSRSGLDERGIWPNLRVARWKLVAIGALSGGLFVGGVAYAYHVFFPVMFDFLTNYNLNVGFAPNYDIVMWTEFIILLSASFGLAAQLPLAMSALAYAEIVPYETFRDKWRYAVLGIFVFGAFFSPPDPFTQLMWATPLVLLYGASLYLAKFVTAARRGGSAHVWTKLRANWNRVLGTYVLASAGVYYFLAAGYLHRLNALLAQAPGGGYQITLEGLPLAGSTLFLALALAWGAVLTFPVLLYYAWPELEPRQRPTSPADVDLDELDAAGVRAAPPEAFEALSEQEALAHAQRAMDDDDPEKARAVLDQFDELGQADDEDDGPRMAEDIAADRQRSAGDVAQERAAGVVDAFTEEETTEEDIGGYYYDLAFILESLTSKAFRVVAVFMVTIGVTFLALYQGVIEYIKDDFLRRLPPEAVADVDIVALHPVEAILFEVKMSVIAGVVVTLPVVLYYAWPAIEERFYGITRSFETDPPLSVVAARWNHLAGAAVVGAGATYYALDSGAVAVPVESVAVPGATLSGAPLTYAVVGLGGLALATPVASAYAWPSVSERLRHDGKRNVFLVWGGTLVFGVLAGSLLGYLYVAPAIISYLVYDAIRAGMIIAYRINNFFWLIFATTVGIGLLAEIPITMWLFHRGGIVSFGTMRDRWRGVVVGIFVVSAFLTPSSLLTMFLVSVPVAAAYLLGLAGLWVVTLPWRVRDRVVRLVGGG